jgi:hypothetical protein
MTKIGTRSAADHHTANLSAPWLCWGTAGRPRC